VAKHVITDMTKCTGCRMCELACSMKHEGVFNLRKARIKVYLIGLPEVPVPVLQKKCNYCAGDPACVKYCVTEAVVYKEAEKPERRDIPKEEVIKIAQEWLTRVSS
jgi:carbon-monoxide dehydrogenase iron sulfur subunit